MSLNLRARRSLRRARRQGMAGWGLVVSLAVLLSATSAFATSKASKASKDIKEKAAKTACLSGDYTRGVALLAELYVRTDEIVHLFNQGRCFEQNGKYEEAISRFREFQRKNTEAGNPPDAAAEQHVADCQALLEQQKPASPAADVPAPAPAPLAPALPRAAGSSGAISAPEGAPTLPEANPVALQASTGGEPGAGLRIAGITALAVGVAGVAAGVVLNLKSNSLASDLDGSASTNNSSTTLYARSKESSRSTYETFSWVGYGVGGACLAAGVILFYVGHSRATDSGSVALLPAAGPGHVGAVVQGAF